MKRFAPAGLIVALALTAPRAQEAAKVEPLHFHHIHLNSTNPKAAAAYYPKPFALSATATTFNGFEAVKTGNVYVLFTKVAADRKSTRLNSSHVLRSRMPSSA